MRSSATWPLPKSGKSSLTQRRLQLAHTSNHDNIMHCSLQVKMMGIKNIILLSIFNMVISNDTEVGMIALDAMRDTDLNAELPDSTSGRNGFMDLGRDQRVLLYFDLEDETELMTDDVTSATLSLTVFSMEDNTYQKCFASPDDCGATIHLMTTEWGEGSKVGGSAIEGDSSWNHNMFPNQWTTPGGDFNPQAIGTLRAIIPPLEKEPENEGTELENIGSRLEFDLDLPTIQSLMREPSSNLGFMLMDDSIPEYITIFAKDCDNGSVCRVYGEPPQLLLGSPKVAPPSTSSSVPANMVSLPFFMVGFCLMHAIGS